MHFSQVVNNTDDCALKHKTPKRLETGFIEKNIMSASKSKKTGLLKKSMDMVKTDVKTKASLLIAGFLSISRTVALRNIDSTILH